MFCYTRQPDSKIPCQRKTETKDPRSFSNSATPFLWGQTLRRSRWLEFVIFRHIYCSGTHVFIYVPVKHLCKYKLLNIWDIKIYAHICTHTHLISDIHSTIYCFCSCFQFCCDRVLLCKSDRTQTHRHHSNSQTPGCLCLPGAGIKVCHHTQPHATFRFYWPSWSCFIVQSLPAGLWPGPTPRRLEELIMMSSKGQAGLCLLTSKWKQCLWGGAVQVQPVQASQPHPHEGSWVRPA